MNNCWIGNGSSTTYVAAVVVEQLTIIIIGNQLQYDVVVELVGEESHQEGWKSSQ